MTTQEKVPINGYLSRYLMNHMQDKARLMNTIILAAKDIARMSNNDNYDYLVEHFKTKMFNTLMRSKVELVEHEWGICRSCDTFFAPKIVPLYRVKYYDYTSNQVRSVDARCKDHVSNAFYYSVLNMSGIDIEFFDKEKDYPEPKSKLLACPVCTKDILPSADEANHFYIGYRGVDALDADGVERHVHVACTYTCSNCEGISRHVSSAFHDRIPGSRATRVNWRDLCPTCYETVKEENGGELNWCNRCEYEHTDDYEYTSEVTGERVCESCYNEEYRCDDCQAWCMSGDDHECDFSDSRVVHNYSYKPEPIFYGKNDKHMFFGLELETEYNGNNSYEGYAEGASVVSEHFNGRFYLKHDGSLNNGFEMVSHPHTMEEFQKLDWLYRDWETDRKSTRLNSSHRL